MLCLLIISDTTEYVLDVGKKFKKFEKFSFLVFVKFFLILLYTAVV